MELYVVLPQSRRVGQLLLPITSGGNFARSAGFTVSLMGAGTQTTGVVLCPFAMAMSITTLSSREFNQDVTRAKKAACHGPVFITARGKPSHVLLSIDEYRRASGNKRSLVDALSMPGLAQIAFEPPRMGALPNAAEFD